MEPTQILPVCLVVLLGVVRASGGSVPLGGSVSLTAAENCSNAEVFALIRRLRDDRPLPVATRVRWVWQPEETYRDRIESRSAQRVLLRRVNANDDGYYEFTCGGRLVSTIRLEVLTPYGVSLSAGETLTLPCHFFTLGEALKSVRWERNGGIVCELDPSTGAIRYGTGFRGRASLRDDWKRDGDLSLALSSARSEDRGDYFCLAHYEGAGSPRQDPAAVVRVREGNPDQTTCPPPHASITRNSSEERAAGAISPATTGLIVFGAFGAFVAGVLVAWCLKSRWSNDSSGSCRDRFATARNKLFSRRCPPHSQSNDGLGARGSYEVVIQ